jgi:hypothetical protein
MFKLQKKASSRVVLSIVWSGSIGTAVRRTDMKLLYYVMGGFLALALALVLIAGGSAAPENNPVVMAALVVLFAIAPVGAFWMMYMSIRYDKNPLPMILLAFIPFTFLWYYFERVRHSANFRHSHSKS